MKSQLIYRIVFTGVMDDSLTGQLPGFDDPPGILKACHQRMLVHCEMLKILQAHIGDKGVDEEARSAIGKVITYFSTSTVQHHQDEEEDLLPMLAHQSLKMTEIIYRLRQ